MDWFIEYPIIVDVNDKDRNESKTCSHKMSDKSPGK